MRLAQRIVKRAVDVAVSASLLALVWPLGALIALLIVLDSPGPVFHRSRRLGLHGKEFPLLKFRSMLQGSPPRYLPDGSMLVDKKDARITRLGRFLRIGLDELPQLWNVLRGEMSLIGPRPDMPYARELYQGEESCRLTVKPGITGLAQVKGRTDIPWHQRLALDVTYVKGFSLWLDLEIAFLTIFELVPPVRRILLRGAVDHRAEG